ncbi:hypothetical protein [Parabacteroides distasonis]|nr:hypothetical protein [Parabacteroides distasonis]MCS2605995.1 hypothetical protein [Parabacteroides distasonis]
MNEFYLSRKISGAALPPGRRADVLYPDAGPMGAGNGRSASADTAA